VKAHFHGGPWDGKTGELPFAGDAWDVEVEGSKITRVRYARTHYDQAGEPHYSVDGLRGVGSELVFPLPFTFL
jgi:hypothetical protein